MRLVGGGLVNCPMCLFSSGTVPYTGGGKSQTCDTCGGKGRISKTKYNELVEEYGDLITVKKD
jgi:DnaJ-class molecular chaperone